MAKLKVRPDDINTDANVQHFVMETFLSGKAFITLALVKATYPGENEAMSFVDVQPMVHGTSGSGGLVERGTIFNVPVWRLQRGSSAIIMDPVVGDIGWIACCDEDIRNVKKTSSLALPASSRKHSYGDAIYMGGLLNSSPNQYVKFSDSGIDITSPLDVNVNGPNVAINASAKASINSPVIELNGAVTQGKGNNGGNAVFGGSVTATGEVQGKGVNLSTHVHGGVESGNSSTKGPQ
ncbi:oxidoreductase [Pseudescherichia vulneris]|uniref:Gp138 family membrane-puncturing spike protein n=1 Tax=Pseudescherichia vulneris TaxID=566 RepID=UPI00227AE5F8|nr:Gp138 family membrane-puncturing spike protein [Pseudescherichia vulneris]WAH52624.1 oxidoreductase [Pseudescherichia vulneris]